MFLRIDKLALRERVSAARYDDFRASLQAGNILLQVIVVIFVLSIGIYFLSDRLITKKNVVLQTSSILRIRFAMQSTMDYMYYLIQRRY